MNNYYINAKKIVFQCSNCNIVLFFYCIKNKIEILNIFINTLSSLYISVEFLSYSYNFYSRLKNTLITTIYY